MPSPHNNIRAHAAFLLVASMLALQSCGGPVAATPASSSAASKLARPAVAAASAIEAGRYLVSIGGCNDCHTPGFPESNGASPAETDWLMGSPVGFSGPWGVSYAPNLRLSLQTMDEAEFIELARAGQGRPPMPWPSLKAMSDEDLKAIYAYVRHLGPKGDPAPAPLSPGVAPDRPHIPFMPVMPS